MGQVVSSLHQINNWDLKVFRDIAKDLGLLLRFERQISLIQNNRNGVRRGGDRTDVSTWWRHQRVQLDFFELQFKILLQNRILRQDQDVLIKEGLWQWIFNRLSKYRF